MLNTSLGTIASVIAWLHKFFSVLTSVFAGSLLLDDVTNLTEQNVVGPSYALADVYCPFKTGLREARRTIMHKV